MSEMLINIRISEHPKIPKNTEEFFDTQEHKFL